MEKNIKIDVVVPTHGAGEAFVECILSLLKQSLTPQRIIIVDNNVKDGSIALLEARVKEIDTKGCEIEITHLPSNTGVTGGRNKGIESLSSDYDYVCFVDHDMIAEPTMLQELLLCAEKSDTIGIVTPKIFYWDNKDIVWSAGTDINRVTGQTLFHGGKDVGQFDSEKEVAIAPAIFLVKRAVMDVVHTFDERYFATYEDSDFCFSALEAGYKTYYAPKAVAYHKIPYDPLTATKRLLDRAYWVGRNRYFFLRKFHLFNLISVLFILVYLVYYTYLALHYNKMNAISDYIRGVLAGLTMKV